MLLALTCAVCLALPMFVGAVGCDNDKTTTSKTIAVIAKGQSHAFWQAVKKGAQDAGAEYGYTVTFTGPDAEDAAHASQHQEQISAALNNNPAAMVLATIAENYAVDLLEQAYDKAIPVIQFDSGVMANDVTKLNSDNKNPLKAKVATSNYDAAALAAENFFAAIKADIAASSGNKYQIGIIQHDLTDTGVQRRKGFEEKFKALADADSTTNGKYEITVQEKDGDSNENYTNALNYLYENAESKGGLKAVFMSNEGVINQVWPYVKTNAAKYKDVKFCGFDAGSNQINWMKNTDASYPTLVGSVAQDSYNIGYKSVIEAIKAALGGKPADVAISGAWYTKDNIDQMINDNLVYEG